MLQRLEREKEMELNGSLGKQLTAEEMAAREQRQKEKDEKIAAVRAQQSEIQAKRRGEVLVSLQAKEEQALAFRAQREQELAEQKEQTTLEGLTHTSTRCTHPRTCPLPAKAY